MSDLHALIRVRKHALDQKQKLLAELYRQGEEYENQKNILLNQLDEERENVQKMGFEMLKYFGPYEKNVKDRVEEIDASIKTLATRIEFAREEMRTAFADVKKLEITQEKREDEEQAARDKKEADELDDIALQGYRREQAEE